MEGIDLVEVDGFGLVSEISVFIRPLPALTALLAELAPQVTRHRGRSAAIAATIFGRTLAQVTRSADALSAPLLRRG